MAWIDVANTFTHDLVICRGFVAAAGNLTSAWAYFVLLLVPIVAASCGYALYGQYVGTYTKLNSPAALFNELAQAHRISQKHQRLLHQIAEASQLEEPTLLFVIPDVFDSAVQHCEAKRLLTGKQRKAIAQLRRQIFETAAERSDASAE